MVRRPTAGRGRLAGRVALVTEADSGIGRAVAIAFAREGVDLVLGCHRRARRSPRTLHAGPSKPVDAHSSHRAICVDEAYRARLVAETVKQFGRLDILITNRAFQWAPSARVIADLRELERELRAHNESIFALSRAAAAQMTAGGSIIHTMPILSAHPTSQMRAYATTQRAIEHFTASFAHQLSRSGIRVNAVAPGPLWPRASSPCCRRRISTVSVATRCVAAPPSLPSSRRSTCSSRRTMRS